MSEVDLLHLKRDQILSVLQRCEFIFKDEARYVAPDDTSYLKDQHRTNPDIMANVDAMAATNLNIEWVGLDEAGWVGIWRATGHIVHLDKEGQYAVVANDVGNYLARASHAFEESWDDDLTAALIAAGFKVSSNSEAAYNLIVGAPNVNAVRDQLYRDARVRRGLPRDY